jgi:hypothetical protein
MKTFAKTIAITAIALASASAFASKPTSIKYIEEIVVEGDQVYAHYQVSCSNGETQDLSAWDNRKQWCAGKGMRDDCSKKQIKAAKKVCK